MRFDGKRFENFDAYNSLIRNPTVADLVIDRNGNKWLATVNGLVFTDLK